MKKFFLIFSVIFLAIITEISLNDRYFYPKIACKFGNESSCSKINIAGNVFMRNSNFKQAETLLKTACDAKFYKACSNLGTLYYTQSDKKDKAEFYFKLSCQNKFIGGCDNLGKFYYKEKEFEKAFAFFKDSCENQNFLQSCTLLAYLYHNGDGIFKNDNEALKFYTKACDGNEYAGCAGAAMLHFEHTQFRSGLKLAEKACAGGIQSMCEISTKIQLDMTIRNNKFLNLTPKF